MIENNLDLLITSLKALTASTYALAPFIKLLTAF
jgi:hypothetical protein